MCCLDAGAERVGVVLAGGSSYISGKLREGIGGVGRMVLSVVADMEEDEMSEEDEA